MGRTSRRPLGLNLGRVDLLLYRDSINTNKVQELTLKKKSSLLSSSFLIAIWRIFLDIIFGNLIYFLSYITLSWIGPLQHEM